MFAGPTCPRCPGGWSKGPLPNLTEANHDWLMSHWLDDLIVALNRKSGEAETPGRESQPLRLKMEATAILLFGESTADSGRFRVLVDGVAVTGKGGQEKGAGNRAPNGMAGCRIRISSRRSNSPAQAARQQAE